MPACWSSYTTSDLIFLFIIFAQFFHLVLILQLEEFLLLLFYFQTNYMIRNHDNKVWFMQLQQLISIPKAWIPGLWHQIPDDLKRRLPGCRTGREEGSLLSRPSLMIGKLSYPQLQCLIAGFLTIQQNQMRWISSAFQQLMVSWRTCFCWI